MEAYAVVQTGGKQYLVKANETLQVESLPVKEGEKIKLSPVFALSDGTTLKVGRPALDGAKVTCIVEKHIRGPKVLSFKKKRRKGYSKAKGHRQELTVLKVQSIG